MALDLRSGEPVWLLDNRGQPYHEALREDAYAEVVVVGAGVSGALLSSAIMQMGMQVILVDEREVGVGSTAASTAILSYETDVLLQDLIKDFGEKKAIRVFEGGAEALSYIEKMIGGLDNDCDFRKRNSVYFASKKSDSHIIEKEFELRKKFGFDLEIIHKERFSSLFSFSSDAALITREMADVNPVKLTRALIRNGESNGLIVYSNTKINGYDERAGEQLLITDQNKKIRAKHVVFASGYETQLFLKQKNVKLISSYAIASNPVNDFPGWYEQSTIWESARPYIYLRTTADNRIVAGGEDIPFENEKIRDALIGEKTSVLKKKVEGMFPHIPFEVATSWAGTFAESKDGLPFIGEHPEYPGAYFALGYGGNGITFSAMACNIIPDLIMGKKNTDGDIFKFDR